jgi:hypothetical protein
LIKIFLDDIRIPFDDQWIIVKDYEQFIEYVVKIDFNEIYEISLDHDLGFLDENYEKTGYDVAKWLIEYCQDNNYILPLIKVHSANTVGSNNIISLINNYLKFMKKDQNCISHTVKLKRTKD